MNNHLIICDIDGVLFDVSTRIIDLVKAQFNYDLSYESIDCPKIERILTDRVSGDEQTIAERWVRTLKTPGFYKDLKPLPFLFYLRDLIKYHKSCIDININLCFLTARPFSSNHKIKEITYRSLLDWGIKDPVIYESDWTKTKKDNYKRIIEHVRRLFCEKNINRIWIIDDNPREIEAAIELCKIDEEQKYYILCPRRPWNAEVQNIKYLPPFKDHIDETSLLKADKDDHLIRLMNCLIAHKNFSYEIF
jgi:5'(3')-deoxyribonucleotidase